MWAFVLVTLVAIVVVVLGVSWLTEAPFFSLKGRVIVITGGSSGIGKAVAKQAAARGSHVAIIARSQAALEQARAEVLASRAGPEQRVSVHSADVSDEAAVGVALRAVAAEHGGVVDVLIACAGRAIPRTVEGGTAAELSDMFALNVLGARNAVAHTLPLMRRPDGGRVVLVSSQAGQVGLFGYAQYSATKFALRGFAEALAMELHTRRIRVSLAFPPDTDTPGLALENEGKPELTRRLSGASATVAPEVVAAALLGGVERWRFFIPVGMDGWLLAAATAGLAPASTLAEAVVQVLFAGAARVAALAVIGGFYSTVAAHDASHVGWAPGLTKAEVEASAADGKKTA